MHPDPAYRSDDRALFESLIEEIAFGMIFAATPDGPRVAHTPLLTTCDGPVQFHLSRGNALTRHLAGGRALIVANGPDAYVSPRWYDDRDTVPTWDYLALELEGRVRRLSDEELEAFLHAAILRHEGRLGGEPWRAGEASERVWANLFRGIVGFEMDVEAWRPTVKLSQKKSAAERARIAAGLEDAGAAALAHLVRSLPA
ncbi:FMN-binding negative transcriptional regulator [Erythrobacter sp. HL-111]|uniref:FMN-binding negative transcriptional regulator n=1 Tax=Erythrobacter sp. HL-111 TaxID=1798193 RepID=UPI0006DB1EBC|nr:FMN-binding negative transcriptional regulator [Erythrobacter sp. HL-111]KPP88104.1 MAG: transcriptional regulator [Erythrobacteraceae bacterium HL-111]SDT09246.1 negative transcriptional regulator, PaiB family [Erythrobacter sp. HL-111]